MIDEIYNSRIGAIKTDHFSDEWEQTAIFTNHDANVIRRIHERARSL